MFGGVGEMRVNQERDASQDVEHGRAQSLRMDPYRGASWAITHGVGGLLRPER